ncbi:MAG: hypothetical protein KDC48_07790 [Planctomycetes bacterium]|nr:hypothetical protein [Planctomycetota bacterium]
MSLLRFVLPTLAALVLADDGLVAQSPCPGFGGHAAPGTWAPAPFSQTCGNTAAPLWRLYTPPHRAPGPRPGYRPLQARALPRLLVTYRCTGLWWLPFVPDRIRVMGYVIDQADVPCAPLTP